jgi:serine/threonine protein kinase, bacterial
LPFPGLYGTKNVAVDPAGNLYVLASPEPAADARFESLPPKLYKLAPGATSATTLEFPGVNFRSASDVAVDKAGNIYFSDGSQVWLLESGKSAPIRLPFRGFSSIQAIAVDEAGNTYALGALMSNDLSFKYGAKKLAPGENRPTDLSVGDLYVPRGIAVDKAGNVYVSASIKGTGHGHVLKLPVGATTPTALPIPGLIEPRHMAFDSAGDIFVTDGFSKAFYELPNAGGPAVKVPVPASTHGVAVDSQDTLYVLTNAITDKKDQIVRPGQVLKIAPDK